MAADITQSLTDEDFDISDEDIISAISAISPDSGCGPDGVPGVTQDPPASWNSDSRTPKETSGVPLPHCLQLLTQGSW